MRRLSLRTGLATAAALMGFYFLAAGTSYWVENRADQALAEAFDKDLAVVVQLPRLRDRLHELDLMTDHYLLSGGTAWLAQRETALAQVRANMESLAAILSGEEERRSLAGLERELEGYLFQQAEWLDAKRSGRMSQPDAVKIASRQRPFDRLVEGMVELRNRHLAELRERRRAARDASRQTAALILLIGLGAAAMAAFLLSRYIISPVRSLEARARTWELGRPWPGRDGPASPELSALERRLEEMAERSSRQYEKEAELSRLKAQLVAIMSHEFNNALSVIQGVTVLLEETEGAAPAQREEYYEMLKANVRSLSTEAATILQMGRLESGQFALKTGPTDVAEILRESRSRLRLLHQRKRQEVLVRAAEGAPRVRGDAEALSLVVTNLLTNAIKYTPEGGRIELRVEPDGPGGVVVGVRDTGIGISETERERVFSGYYRAEAGKIHATGFGVGLALAKRIVEAHGSRLELESAPGKGSDFHFSLPAWKEAA